MKKINKAEPPEEFVKFVKSKKCSNWKDINPIRSKLRDHILIHEQNSQCAYCEKEISSEGSYSNIDHFKLRHYFPELTFNYQNLVVSCNKYSHCSSRKDRKINSKENYNQIINPVDESPSAYLEFDFSGKIFPLNDKANNTINVFNLNHHSLVQQRSDVYFSIQAYKGFLDMEEVISEVGSFEGFIRSIW